MILPAKNTNSKNSSDIAGLKSTSKFLAVTRDETAGNVKKIIVDRTNEFEIIDDIYVVDKNNILEGTVSLRELLQTPNETKLETIMKKKCSFSKIS